MMMRCVGFVALLWVAWAGTVLGYSRGRPTTAFPPQDQKEEVKKEEVYCQCVPYYQCMDGVIITDGSNLMDFRSVIPLEPVTNVEQCPGLIDVCCGIPPPPTPSTTSIPATTPYSTLPPETLPPTLPPDTPCSCVSFFDCPPERLVSDGLGNTTLDFLGFSYSHSQCRDSFSLCCAVEATPTPTPTPTPAPPTPFVPKCECVPPYLCDANGELIVDGYGLLDVRTRFGYHETPSGTPQPFGECPVSYFVCCRPPGTPSPTTPSPPPTTSSTPVTSTTTATNVDLMTSTYTNYTIESSSTEPPTTTSTISTTTTEPPPVSCGIRNSDGIVVRISGFVTGESQFGEFPWVAAVLTQELVEGLLIYRFVGGGTLVHPRVIVTAAHKVTSENASSLLVRVGEWDTQKHQEPYPHQDIEVESIVVHPHFYASALFNDVALLFLKEEAVLGPHVNTLCLAKSLDEVDSSACVINGWGVHSFDMGEYQTVMKSLTLPLVPRPNCVNSLRRTRLGAFFRLHPSFICAGGEKGKDACKGDGGGPLSCPMKGGKAGRHLLVGVTAWGIGCGEDGVPGVYVNVPFLHAWITETVEHFLPTTTTTSTTATTTTTASTTTARPKGKKRHHGPGARHRHGNRRKQELRRAQEIRRKQKKRSEQENRRDELMRRSLRFG